MLKKRLKGASSDAPFHFISECADKLILGILLVGISVFILYPMVCIVLRSFESDAGFTIAAYTEVWERYGSSLWNSLWTGCVTAVLCTILSVATALVISTSRGWIKMALMAIILITILFWFGNFYKIGCVKVRVCLQIDKFLRWCYYRISS